LKEGPDGTDGQDGRMEGRWAHWMKKKPAVKISFSHVLILFFLELQQQRQQQQ